MYNIEDIKNTIIQGHVLNVLKNIPDSSIDMIITSPPYWGLRNYNTNPQVWDEDVNCEHEWESEIISTYCIKCRAWKGELGSEPSFNLYIKHLCDIFDEVKRVLTKDGTCWVNLGDTYGGTQDKGNYKDPKYPNGRNGQSKAINKNTLKKSLCAIPDRFKVEMIDRGWICRNDIVWHKPNAMPSSVKDRFTVDYERLFFFTKNKKYYFEQQLEEYRSEPQKPINKNQQNCNKGYTSDRFSDGYRDYYSQGGRNKRCVWSINTKPFKESHFAVFPEELIETPIKAGSPENGIVMDIFMGSGTTGIVAQKLNRNYIGVELSHEYICIAERRLKD
jgi:site-specific DNA-methyltransferase (cytosine-N4-specific)